MAKKVWRCWQFDVTAGMVERDTQGKVNFLVPNWQTVFRLTPSEARRLSQKLSGDYRD